MNPIYKFQLSAGADTRQAFPTYRDDLAIEYALEQNQEFYRGKLSGKLTFLRDDYIFIRAKAFDTQFNIVIYISYDAGKTWTEYWTGEFWKTDCAFNEDDQTVTVTPNVNDRYNAVLAGLDKEYNLIDLVPAIQPIKLDKRPMIQVYVPGQSVLGCFLSGMWWEQECTAVDNESDLESKYHFQFNKGQRQINVTQTGGPELPDIFFGQIPQDHLTNYEFVNGGYKFKYTWTLQSQYVTVDFEIFRVSDSVKLWVYNYQGQRPPTAYPLTVTLEPVSGTDATGTVELFIHDVKVYCRYVTDVEQGTYQIEHDDLVENNRNYRRVVQYYLPDTIWFSDYLSTSPTKWGIYQPGLYFDDGIPSHAGVGETFPIARTSWGRISLWFIFSSVDIYVEEEWRKRYILKDAFPIWSVISVLLAKIAPGITHEESVDYSRFLYGVNPLETIDQRLFIAPKSNVISAGYDEPARKAKITLKQVLDTLRDCFRCYWFIDEQNRFRVEHIAYFMRGGTYDYSEDVIEIDLTQQRVTRNGKPWSYVSNKYEYDKPDMAARYQFEWMDDVTEPFEGHPIDIVSKYVNPENTEQISISQFTSDVDYVLLNPGAVSKDGFVLLGATKINLITPDTSFTQTPFVRMIDRMMVGEKISFKIEVTSSLSGKFLAVSFVDANQQVINTFVNGIIPPGASEHSGSVIVPEGAAGLQFSSNGIMNVKLLSVLGDYELPYINFYYNNTNHYLQNGWVSFMFLQKYYMYDMPASSVEINGVQQLVRGMKKLKTQTIKFPVLKEPNFLSLVKTELGDGVIQKMSVNLSSRSANTTLKYDTE